MGRLTKTYQQTVLPSIGRGEGIARIFVHPLLDTQTSHTIFDIIYERKPKNPI